MFLSFSDDDIETISLSEAPRNGSNDFPDPQEVSLYHVNSLQLAKPDFSLLRDCKRTGDGNNNKSHLLRDVVLMNFLILSTNFEDVCGNQ